MKVFNRGSAFEKAMRDSWATSNLNIERLRVSDKVGAERISDDLIVGEVNVYAEYKSTGKKDFPFSMIKAHQYRALHEVSAKRRNTFCRVFIEFRNSPISGGVMVSIEIKDILDMIRHGWTKATPEELVRYGGKMSYFNDGRYPVEEHYNVMLRKYKR